MLKHVQLSPYRARADTASLASTSSYAPSTRSIFSHSRASSISSLCGDASSPTGQTPPHTIPIKVYARCLRMDIEYKTLSVGFETTSRQVIISLLNKYRVRHRDSNLFYLTMEVTVRRAGIRTTLVLDDSARPASLQACHPRGDSKFSLQMRRGGLVKIYDSVLMPGSQYKSLLISERTTVDELIQLLLNSYNTKRHEKVEQFSLYEFCPSNETQRKLHPDDCPLRVQQAWPLDTQYRLVLRRRSQAEIKEILKESPEETAVASSPSTSSTCSFNSSSSSRCSTSSSTSSSSSSLSSNSTQPLYADYENYFYI